MTGGRVERVGCSERRAQLRQRPAEQRSNGFSGTNDLESLGLLSGLVPPEALKATTMALAQRIEHGPPLAYAALKSAVYGSLGDLDAALRREREGQLKLLESQDMLEGVAAWSQKRPPNFTGA